MGICVDSNPENCNHCIFNQSMSRHWDLEDYCLLNKKCRSKIIMDKGCLLKEIGGQRCIMKLNERVAIITEENINRLSRLYGEMSLDVLSKIVNNHMEVVIDEIEEDCSKQRMK